MSHSKKIVLLLLCGSMCVLPGCYKNKTVYFDTTEVTRTVSFSKDLIPIFSKSCSLSGCHASGGQTPNLSETNAYNSLIIGNYVNKSNPEASLIYLKMTGKKGTPMPPAGSNKDYNSLVLAWIKQGANNN